MLTVPSVQVYAQGNLRSGVVGGRLLFIIRRHTNMQCRLLRRLLLQNPRAPGASQLLQGCVAPMTMPATLTFCFAPLLLYLVI